MIFSGTFWNTLKKLKEKIENFTAGLDYAGFIADEKTVYAVIRCFEVIGEAVKNIPDTVKRRYPQVPWSRMAGMRDKLIHAYFGVDYETLMGNSEEENSRSEDRHQGNFTGHRSRINYVASFSSRVKRGKCRKDRIGAFPMNV